MRVARVAELARRAGEHSAESLVRAAEACNLAALIASDCGMHELAIDLCRRQFAIFQAGPPYDAATAKLALQPLINLGRLHLRHDNPDAAYRLLTEVIATVQNQTEAAIDNQTVALGELVDTQDDHREVLRWLWTVLLSDATRALARAGRWDDALAHARQHRGIGQRLLDGRQVAIIAAATAGNHRTAAELLAATDTPTPWEQAVAPCLAALCRQLTQRPAHPHDMAIVHRYLALEPQPGQVVFHTRLGLAVLDLTDGEHQPVTDAITTHALASGDAYAAREATTHERCRTRTQPTHARLLAELVDAACLDHGSIPADTSNDLMLAVAASETALTEQLARAARPNVPARRSSQASAEPAG